MINYALAKYASLEKAWLSIRQHTVIIFSLGFIAAILIQDIEHIVLFIIATLLTPLRFSKKAFLLGILLGIIISASYQHTLKQPIQIGQQELSGIAIEPVDRREYGESIVIDAKNLDSHVFVQTEKYSDINQYDWITAQGELNNTYQVFSENFSNYLASKNIYYVLDTRSINSRDTPLSYIVRARTYLSNIVFRNVTEPGASLVNGMLFGSKESFSEEFEDFLRNSGTTHIISASGFNVAIVYVMIQYSLFFLNKRAKYLLSIPMVWLYILLIGIHIIPAVRAAIMFSYISVAKLSGKPASVWNALLFSSVSMLMGAPYLIHSLSFQLSILATIGIVLIIPILQYINDQYSSMKAILLEGIVATTAATLATSIITITTFGQISIVSVPVNTVIAPLIPIITTGGILGISFNVFGLNTFSSISFTFSEGISKVLSTIIESSGTLPFAYSDNILVMLAVLLPLSFILFYFDYERYSNNHLKN